MPVRVGIIANPAAGKDVRRLVSEARIVSSNEKVALLRRMFVGLLATGVRGVLYMPDAAGLVQRAAFGLEDLALSPLEMLRRNSSEDTHEAARLLAEAGVRAVLTLGGDGTNRVVAKAIGRVPLLPLSTGTNNAFPQLVEATTAGIALGLVATGKAPGAVRQRKRVEVWIDGELSDIALVDAAVLKQDPFGAQAVWKPEEVACLVLAEARPGAVGWSAVLGVIDPLSPEEPEGALVRFDPGASARVTAPIAPGLCADIGIGEIRRLALTEPLVLGPGRHWLALDGEPLVRSAADQTLTLQVTAHGPHVIDVTEALLLGARCGALSHGGVGGGA